MTSKQKVTGLALFGIALGVAELVAPRKLAKAAGVERQNRIVQLFGLREILTGLMILASGNPRSTLWTRVAGDGLDALLLTVGMRSGNPKRSRAMLAAMMIAPVAILDYLHADKSWIPQRPAR